MDQPPQRCDDPGLPDHRAPAVRKGHYRHEARDTERSTRRTAEAEAEALHRRAGRTQDLECNKETLLSTYAELVPEQLDALTSEERRRVYGMLRLRWEASADGTLGGRGVLSEKIDLIRGMAFGSTNQHLPDMVTVRLPWAVSANRT